MRDDASAAFLAGPKGEGAAPARLIDTTCAGQDLVATYTTAVQGWRLLGCDRTPIWKRNAKVWSHALIGADGAGNIAQITFFREGGEDVVMTRPEEGSNEMLLWRLYETTRFSHRRRRTELQSAIHRAHAILSTTMYHAPSHAGREAAAAAAPHLATLATDGRYPPPMAIKWKTKPLPESVAQQLQAKERQVALLLLKARRPMAQRSVVRRGRAVAGGSAAEHEQRCRGAEATCHESSHAAQRSIGARWSLAQVPQGGIPSGRLTLRVQSTC